MVHSHARCGTENQEVVHMSKPYGKDSDELNAVVDCHMKKMTYADAVKELNSKGFSFSEKKYQRYLSFIRKTMPQRLERFATEEYATSIVTAVNTIDHVQTELMKAFDDSRTDIWKKIQLANSIMQCLVAKEKFFDASPVVASLAKKINHTGEEDVQERGKKVSQC